MKIIIFFFSDRMLSTFPISPFPRPICDLTANRIPSFVRSPKTRNRRKRTESVDRAAPKTRLSERRQKCRRKSKFRPDCSNRNSNSSLTKKSRSVRVTTMSTSPCILSCPIPPIRRSRRIKHHMSISWKVKTRIRFLQIWRSWKKFFFFFFFCWIINYSTIMNKWKKPSRDLKLHFKITANWNKDCFDSTLVFWKTILILTFRLNLNNVSSSTVIG